MERVYVLGVGLHPFGRFPDKSFGELGRIAVNGALEDAGVGWKDIQIIYATSFLQGAAWGTKIANACGATGIPVVNMEAACCSTSAAIAQATYAIASGQLDLVLCVGGEKQERGFIPTEDQPHWMRHMGLGTYPSMYAQMMQRHMLTHGTTLEQMAWISIKSHKNASLNPKAHYRNMADLTVESVLNSRMVCDPFRLLMIAPTSEGAGAVVIGNKRAIKKFNIADPIEIAACVQRSHIYDRETILYPPPLLPMVAKEAYEQAGMGPQDIDIAMIQDGMPIGEIEGLEQMGFCEEGMGGTMAVPINGKSYGRTWIEGDIPVNTDGGYMSRGNCVGATGAAGFTEVVTQLRGKAGARQVRDPKVGLVHNMGAGIQCSVAILKK
ncbi:MAG: thiolase family protein [Deltaproteobacteria bacterium]|nr:thiolase family protein [Deltaproteobacteria bacterium]